MSVHPIENRYGSDQMRTVFDEENRFQRMLDVEAALAKTLSEEGMIPKTHGPQIARKAKIKHVSVEEIRELEEKTGHETMALVLALAEASENAGRSVHLGATSSDILDTGLALQLREAIGIIENRIFELLDVIIERAEKHSNTLMVGRTHGQHAVPTTFGMKFALWGDELRRHIERLDQIKSRVLVGQMSGAVGTGAPWGDKGPKIQSEVMEKLDLKPVKISNQVIQRDRYAELVSFLSLLGNSLAKMAREVRNLQRTEIGEVAEKFEEDQVGSSTMPHKRNPVESELVCGLARALRAHVQAAHENIILEHERDLTHSSTERALFSECFLLMDEMLMGITEVLNGLTVYAKKMETNLDLTRGLNMAEAIMIELTRRGMDRQKAHETLRECSDYAVRENVSLSTALQKESDILDNISKDEIEDLINPESYLGSAEAIVNRVIKDLKELREG